MQSNVTKKSGRYHRNHASGRSRRKATSVQEEQAVDAQDITHSPTPALLTGPEHETHTQPEPKSTLPALVPQRLPMVYGARPEDAQAEPAEIPPQPKRKLRTLAQALVLSACLTAALVFSIGMFKGRQSESQVAQAETTAPLAASLPDAAASESAAGKGASSEKASAAPHPAHGNRKPAATARKPVASAKPALAHNAPSRPAATEKKNKTTASLAKASVTTHAEYSAPPLAQTTSAPKMLVAQNNYARCEEFGNFFRREQCKWQVCNGKWGQDGCPSYGNNRGDVN